VPAVDALLVAVSELHQLHTLRLRMPRHANASSFVGLQQLPLLRDLELDVALPNVARFAAELRSFTLLHRLHITAFGVVRNPEKQRAALFNALLGDAPEEQLRVLQWRDFAIDELKFTDELTPLLCRLPLLERLEVRLSDCTRFDFLTALPKLTHLQLDLWMMADDAWKSLLGVFTSDGLSYLHSLSLRAGPCTSDDLTLVLSHTPSLTSLELHDLEGVSSLSFFRELAKLSETLTELTVRCEYLWRLPVAELTSLYALQQLRWLWLWNLKGLTAADSEPFAQRPCIVLPQLTSFDWTPGI
jgi:hypothetical protein